MASYCLSVSPRPSPVSSGQQARGGVWYTDEETRAQAQFADSPGHVASKQNQAPKAASPSMCVLCSHRRSQAAALQALKQTVGRVLILRPCKPQPALELSLRSGAMPAMDAALLSRVSVTCPQKGKA